MADFFDERDAVYSAFSDWEVAQRPNRTPWERSRALLKVSQALERCDAAANIERDRIWEEDRCGSEAPGGRSGPCVQPRGHPGQHSGPVHMKHFPTTKVNENPRRPGFDTWDPVDEPLTDG